MGVAGSGKTTIGSVLARELRWTFFDGDDFHPPANIEKIKRGIPLNDADRGPWLLSIRAAMLQWVSTHLNVVLACSALKEAYRRELAVTNSVRFVYLRGAYETIYERLRKRHGHFATEQILSSQFATLEEPADAVAIDISGTPQQIVDQIRQKLDLT
jgi:gluconokinase